MSAISDLSGFFMFVGFVTCCVCACAGAALILRGAFAALLFHWRRRGESDVFVREEAIRDWRRE